MEWITYRHMLAKYTLKLTPTHKHKHKCMNLRSIWWIENILDVIPLTLSLQMSIVFLSYED